MFNPFAEIAEGDHADAELVEQAKNGDRGALERLILRHQAWIYNIAVRMVFQPQDAEEVTQEVLVKVITKLSTFRGESAFRTFLSRDVREIGIAGIDRVLRVTFGRGKHASPQPGHELGERGGRGKGESAHERCFGDIGGRKDERSVAATRMR